MLRNRKALMFTVAAALFAIVVFTVVAVRLEQSREKGEALVYSVRCDELNSFLDDMTTDLQRAGSISGKRAAIYAINVVVTNGTALDNATKYLDEMTLYGTFNGAVVEGLENQSLEDWTFRIDGLAVQRDFSNNLNISQIAIDTVPFKSDEYWVRTRIIGLEIDDDFGYCSFKGDLPREKKWINSNVSVDFLEDPLYMLNTKGYVSRTIVMDKTYSLEQHGSSDVIIADIQNEYYHAIKDGPSFFERLEGKQGSPDDAERHEYYENKTYYALLDEGFDITIDDVNIGLETFVDVNELYQYVPPAVQPLIIKSNQTVVDHWYFGPTRVGKKMENVTTAYSWFRIDLNHSELYNIEEGDLY